MASNIQGAIEKTLKSKSKKPENPKAEGAQSKVKKATRKKPKAANKKRKNVTFENYNKQRRRIKDIYKRIEKRGFIAVEESLPTALQLKKAGGDVGKELRRLRRIEPKDIQAIDPVTGEAVTYHKIKLRDLKTRPAPTVRLADEVRRRIEDLPNYREFYYAGRKRTFINIDERKNVLISLLDDLEGSMSELELENYLTQNEEIIFNSLDAVTYASESNDVQISLSVIAEVLNKGPLRHTDAEALEGYLNYYYGSE